MNKNNIITSIVIYTALSNTTVLATEPDKSKVAPPPSTWVGQWSFASSGYSSSSVEIDQLNASGFHFSFSATHGINIGEFEGTATFVVDNIAVAHVDACTVTFQLRSDAIDISTSDCDSIGGNGVYFGGHYGRGFAVLPPMPTLAEQGFLFSPEQQLAFAKMVGKALDRFVIIVENGGTDLDGFGAKVTEGCPPHMCDMSRSIVMATIDGKLWAATIDSETKVILYYSNVSEWTKKLPQTILDWSGAFKDYTIVYASS